MGLLFWVLFLAEVLVRRLRQRGQLRWLRVQLGEWRRPCGLPSGSGTCACSHTFAKVLGCQCHHALVRARGCPAMVGHAASRSLVVEGLGAFTEVAKPSAICAGFIVQGVPC